MSIENIDYQKNISLSKQDALIIVDVQNDFLLDGSLAVPNAEEIIPILNDYIEIFQKKQGKIFATRDWHPPNHLSFLDYGGIWPAHCVRYTEGAKFNSSLNLPKKTVIISKATDPNIEAYSGFENTDLLKILKNKEIKRIFLRLYFIKV